MKTEACQDCGKGFAWEPSMYRLCDGCLAVREDLVVKVRPVIYLGDGEARVARDGEPVSVWGVYVTRPGDVEMHHADFESKARAEDEAEMLRGFSHRVTLSRLWKDNDKRLG